MDLLQICSTVQLVVPQIDNKSNQWSLSPITSPYLVKSIVTCIQKLKDCMNTSTVVSSLKPTFQTSRTSGVVDDEALSTAVAVTMTRLLLSVIDTKLGVQTTTVTRLTSTIDSLARPTLHQTAP